MKFPLPWISPKFNKINRNSKFRNNFSKIHNFLNIPQNIFQNFLRIFLKFKFPRILLRLFFFCRNVFSSFLSTFSSDFSKIPQIVSQYNFSKFSQNLFQYFLKSYKYYSNFTTFVQFFFIKCKQKFCFAHML